MRDIVVDARDIWPDYRPTRLIELPALARTARVGRVFVKLEGERPLGNFKALGGMVAGLRALARVAGVSQLRELRVDTPDHGDARNSTASGRGPQGEALDHGSRGEALGSGARRSGDLALPTLVCASAGNHGLAVAAAARWAGTHATVYLAEGANRARAARIEALGARVVWVAGTYDDAVERAANDGGLLIADTSANPEDQVVRDVMDGYTLIGRELIEQLDAGWSQGKAGADGSRNASGTVRERGAAHALTHLFVQAGVGGLASALTRGLCPIMRAPQRVLVVEPQSAACVAAALAAGHPVQVPGQLSTRAEMLACGLASAPAIKILCEHNASSVLVSEALLQQATTRLRDVDGLLTTASGATGLAGLLHVSSQAHLRELHQLDEASCVLLIVTEGPLPSSSTIFGTSQI